MFERPQVETIARRIQEANNPLIQVVVGPRQTGKRTMISQALRKVGVRAHFVSSDDAIIPSVQWLQTEW